MVIAVSALICDIIKRVVISRGFNWVKNSYINKELYDNDEAVIDKRAHNLAKFCFGIPFYGTMTIWGLYCIWPCDYLMPYLGGNNGFSAIINCLLHFP